MSAANVDVEELTLSDEWKIWIAENRMQGLPDAEIVEILVKNGVSEALAQHELALVEAKDPLFEAGKRITSKLKKMESLLGVYSDLSALSSTYGTVERKDKLSRQDFFESHYVLNRPVILTDIMNGWKALDLWSPEYLRSVCGSEMVEVMTGRESDPQHELNLDSHRTEMSMSEYVDIVVKGGASNDCYMVANNFFLKKECAQRLLDDIEIFPEYLDGSDLDGTCSFWFGPAGTVTALHHDTINIFMAQVYGHKRVTLVPSAQLSLVYNNLGVYSDVNLESPNYADHPLFECADTIEVTLSPGEVLFIPVGWWHHVKALDISISLSFINFLFPNRYAWSHP